MTATPHPAARIAPLLARASEPRPAGAEAPWPDPAPLGDGLPPVDSFTLELLPSALRAAVQDIAERMQVPPDYPAAAAIVSLAGCVNRRAVIIPKREDSSWRVVPNLWSVIIAAPGLMKSPMLHAVTQPLARIEERWRVEYESELATFELEKEKAELRWQGWREEFKRATKKDAKLPLEPDRTLAPPRQRRLVLIDATFEKLHEILADNPAGVFVVRDELTGWLAALDRQGREGERAFYLSAWNGDTGHTIDRIGRGSIHVAACCVSLVGNIQPARLRWYLSQALEGGPADDGLIQRFQVAVWPDPPRAWKLVDRSANEAALEQAARVFGVLAEISTDEPVSLRFAKDAQELFFAWLTELETKLRSDSLAPALVAHLSKYRSLMPTLAGLFELADYVASNRALPVVLQISLDRTRRSAALCDYLESHARRVYSCIVSPDVHAAHELARHIRAGDLREELSAREIYRRGWAGLDGPERVRAALAVLEDAGWLRGVKIESPSGGRPTELWKVSPKVKGEK